MGNLSPVGGWTSAEFVPRENVIDKGRQRSRAVPWSTGEISPQLSHASSEKQKRRISASFFAFLLYYVHYFIPWKESIGKTALYVVRISTAMYNRYAGVARIIIRSRLIPTCLA